MKVEQDLPRKVNIVKELQEIREGPGILREFEDEFDRRRGEGEAAGTHD